ncbi:hypothetical protein Sdagh_39740 [Streptomyces daghestanicus]|uniref:Uncharacterized protein n=1 Tax=Streptomyces daghestanicus TaxID=66885 RepID=A0ABQ3Q4R5_9ACTN|nr:hypothetical protein Sdagh_39740 [Streptomyces daghestanicus]
MAASSASAETLAEAASVGVPDSGPSDSPASSPGRPDAGPDGSLSVSSSAVAVDVAGSGSRPVPSGRRSGPSR